MSAREELIFPRFGRRCGLSGGSRVKRCPGPMGSSKRINDCGIPRQTSANCPWNKGDTIRSLPIRPEHTVRLPDRRGIAAGQSTMNDIVDHTVARTSTSALSAGKSMSAIGIDRCTVTTCVKSAQDATQSETCCDADDVIVHPEST